MTRIDEVAEGTYLLQAEIPGAPDIFSIYVIKGTRGVLIEPGPATLVPTIKAAINDLGLNDLKYIIPTHIHLDHAGALGELSQLFPQAKVVVHPQGARHIIDPSQLIRSTKMAFGDEFEAIYGTILPVPESKVKVVSDGERLLVDGRELMIIYTPGHAPHHIAVFDTKVRGLFCGEALGLIYGAGSEPLPATPPPSFDAEDYLNSMERLGQLKPGILLYSHGGISSQPEKLISTAAKNTKIVGDAILHALKTGKTDEAVTRGVGEYILTRFGVRLKEFNLAMIVGGYILYFKKKGLV